MAITPNFTASVTFASPSILSLTDSSTGSDNAISQRRVFLQQFDGSYLLLSGVSTTNPITGYFPWDYSVSFIDLDVLNRDYALNIIVQWLNSSNVVLYTKALVFDFTTYSQFGNLKYIKALASNPSLIDNPNFFNSKIQLTVAIDDADNAISLGSDIASSQAALDRAYKLIHNHKLFF